MEEFKTVNTLSKAQEAFIHALLELMKHKPFDTITISELSAQAQYDRRTYYRYFKSIDDILALHCAWIMKEMAAITIRKGKLTPYSGFLSYFEFWDKHRDFLKLLDRQHLLYFLEECQENMIYQQVGLSVHDDLPEQLSDTPEFSQFAFHFTLGGIWAVLVFWIKSGMKQKPKQLTEHILNSFSAMDQLIE